LLAAYLDESVDAKFPQRSYVVGSVIGAYPVAYELGRRWGRLLERVGIAHFKASDCYRGRGEFARFVATPGEPTLQEQVRLDAIGLEFTTLIASPASEANRCIAQSVTVDQADFRNLVMQNPIAKHVLGPDPYRLAYALAMILCAWTVNELKGISKPAQNQLVTIMCDSHTAHSDQALGAYQGLLAANPEASHHLGSYSMLDDKSCPQLQAADLIAFERRHAQAADLEGRTDRLREAFQLLIANHVVHIMTRAAREQLENIVRTHNPGEPYTLADVMAMRYEGDIALGTNPASGGDPGQRDGSHLLLS